MMSSELFGKNDKIKILECLIDNLSEELSIEEIVEITEVKKDNVIKHINFLLEEELIIINSVQNGVKFYKLNKKNEIVKQLVIVDNLIVINYLDKIIKKYKE